MAWRKSVSLLLLALWAGGSSFVSAQTPPPAGGEIDLPGLHARAMQAFNGGNFAQAATDLEAITTRAEFSPQLEPVFFTLGSAYFNAGDYNKAAAAYKNYLAKFPAGPRAAEAQFALAQCSLQNKDFTAAAQQFAVLEKDPRFREQALLYQANALKETGRIDQAIQALESLAGGELKTRSSVRGALTLAQLYAQKGAAEKAVKTVEKIHENLRLVDNIVELNAITVELGDELFNKKSFAEALACYRSAYPREQIIRMQNERIGAMQAAIESNLAAGRADPSQFPAFAAQNQQLKAEIENSQKLLQEFEKLPSITPAIYIRLGRCFYEIDRKWEAIVVYQELLDRFPEAAEREPALFGIIVALAEVEQPAKAQARCEEYLKDFKSGPNAETVGYLLGAMSLQANDPVAAEAYFGRMLETQPKSSYREQIRFLLGNAKLMAGKYDEARAEYEKYLKEFPKGGNLEEVTYRIALSSLFAGNYERAMKEIGEYLKKYPKGTFVADAKYRLAVCKYAASLYDDVVNDMKAWEEEFKENPQLGEVLALRADAVAALGRDSEAGQLYVRAYQAATTDEVMNYSLEAASKIFQKRGEWDKVSSLYAGFISERPDHPTVLTALYWIGKAKAREGKVDEAKKITADTIMKYIGDPQREPVEMLLTQLAQLTVRKKRPTDQEPAAGAPAAPTDPAAELEALLSGGEGEPNATTRARILYAKAELARLQRQPEVQAERTGEIAQFKPEELSPVLLGVAGDHLVAQKKYAEARAFFQYLMEEFPKSDSIDFAYNGLGEIALAEKDLPRALRFFSEGTDKIVAVQKMKELTIGKAQTLFAMGRFVEAKKLFEQIASVREWRGEATAMSVFSLGEIEAKQGRWAEANAYFQRVYVGYQKFLPWVAKAYLRSAESFEKLNKPEEAVKTYRELLRVAQEKQELAKFGETEEARKRLAALNQG